MNINTLKQKLEPLKDRVTQIIIAIVIFILCVVVYLATAFGATTGNTGIVYGPVWYVNGGDWAAYQMAYIGWAYNDNVTTYEVYATGKGGIYNDNVTDTIKGTLTWSGAATGTDSGTHAYHYTSGNGIGSTSTLYSLARLPSSGYKTITKTHSAQTLNMSMVVVKTTGENGVGSSYQAKATKKLTIPALCSVTVQYHKNGATQDTNYTIPTSYSGGLGGTKIYKYTNSAGTVSYWGHVSNKAYRYTIDTSEKSASRAIRTVKVFRDETYKNLDSPGLFGWKKTGYHYDAEDCWNLKADGTGVKFHVNDNADNTTNKVTSKRLNGGTQISDNETVVLYVRWKPNTYNITYELNGGTHGEEHPTTATYDTAFTVSHPTKEGYDFTGWTVTGMTELQTGTSFKNLTSTNNGSVTFTANWEEHTAQLTYDANGHGTAPDAITMKYTEAVNAANAITADEYVFKEWNTKADGTGTAYQPGAQIKAANTDPTSLILYAIWQHPGTITITKEWDDNLTGEDADNRPAPTITIEGERIGE